MTEYIVNETDAGGQPVGVLSYAPGREVRPGEACSDVPKASIKDLLARGVIRKASAADKPSTEPREG